MRRIALLAPLQHRPFRLLFYGQVISNLGDWLDILALLALIVYRWDLGPGTWGAFLIAFTLPMAVVGPFAGVWADRWPRRRVMLTCDLLRAAIVLALVWAPNMRIVVPLVFASSVCSTFFGPAQKATIRATVPDADLLAANALSRLSDNAARLIGPALGGLLVAVAGPRAAFVGDSLSFLGSALLIARLAALPGPGGAGAARSHYWHDLRAGLLHIGRNRLLLIAVVGTSVSSYLIRSTDTLGTVLDRALGVTQNLLGFTFVAGGAGYVAGSLVVGQWGQRFRPVAMMGAARAVVGVVLAARGVTLLAGLHGPTVVAAVVLPSFFVAGVGFAAMSVANGYLIQRETPHALMGRVSATASALDESLPIPAPLIATFIAAHVGLGEAYTVLGGLLALVGGILLIVRRIDRLGTPNVPREQSSDALQHAAS